MDAGRLGQVYYAEGEYLHDVKALAETTPWRRHWQMGIQARRTRPPYHLLSKQRHYVMGRAKTWWCLCRSGTRPTQGLTYCTHALGPILRWFRGDRIVRVCCEDGGSHYADTAGRPFAGAAVRQLLHYRYCSSAMHSVRHLAEATLSGTQYHCGHADNAGQDRAGPADQNQGRPYFQPAM